MRLSSHRDLIVWKKSLSLATDIYRFCGAFPHHQRYGLVSQLQGAAVSIPCNIAVGHARFTRKEFLNALSVARGSASEVETLLLISQRLGYGDRAEAERCLAEVDGIRRMLTRMRTRLKEGGEHKG
ncbi:MAG: four helix bundle protein [Gemmatimonadaceae bacterium]|nr:four helix bundle protein [Gemmatimonadaceae bacterium]